MLRSWVAGARLLRCLSILLLVLATAATKAATTPIEPTSSDPAASVTGPASSVISLGRTWKFKPDPAAVGLRPADRWFGETFDDAAWKSLESGRSWESQGISYSGYAWYRQRLVLPATIGGKPLKLTLAEIFSDDDVFFNGVRIGGLQGDYKYRNTSLRVYYIPPELVHAGSENTIAIRLWGGRLGFQGAKSGLVAGPYTIEAVPFGLAARDVGADARKAQPIQLYDLSDAQRGRPFELVFRFDLPASSGRSATLSYKLMDFYGGALKIGETSIAVDSSGIPSGIVQIDPQTSRKIYRAGRFKVLAIVKDRSSGALLSQTIFAEDHLLFAKRDERVLPPLPDTRDDTPYGTLKLVDEVDAGTPDEKEIHPYLQSGFGVHAQDYMTPGSKADVTVHTILGRPAREASWSWFAYRLGRGKLVPGHTYLLRIAYPEDEPRYAPIEIQTGQDYMDVGWKNGISPTDVYDNWPLSQAWQSYDVVVPLGAQTVGSGGAEDGNGANGFWVYFMDQRKPGFYFSEYRGGPAVSTIKLYEIEPATDAPRVTLPPSNLPRRMMTFDWERQPTAPPADIVAYARLMGYSAVSPTILKWGLTSFASPLRGYTSASVDAAHYWETSPSSVSPAATPKPANSVHEQYLDATRARGIDYLPRVEYGGSNVLPIWARAIGADGRPARPDRFASWGADLLSPATLTDFKAYLDGLFRPYVAANPQLKGILWRSRQDRLQISYSREDISLFAQETAVQAPDNLGGMTPAEAAEWAVTPPVAPLYVAWWQKRRAAFHAKVAQALRAYRPDMTMLYFNWDQDKFSLLEPDRLSSAFAARMQAVGGPAAYAADREQRLKYSVNDYLDVLGTGQFSGSLPQIRRPSPWPDYALLPSLYDRADGVQLLAPVPGLPYAAMPQYIDYFRTKAGLAVSNIVSYDEIGAREPNPKYEGAMVLPGGAAFSMSVELLAYFYGDVRTLTYTTYTYGRGFADAHRRFAQAFRALPALPGRLVAGTPADVAVRTYEASPGAIYLGVAHKGYQPRSLSIDIPGEWSKSKSITDLVTGKTKPIEMHGGNLRLAIDAGAMELDAYLVR